jgi:hypothetical protein
MTAGGAFRQRWRQASPPWPPSEQPAATKARTARAALAAALLAAALLVLIGTKVGDQSFSLQQKLQPKLQPLQLSPSHVAVLVEVRPAAKLPAVVANFAAVLPSDWRLQLFASEAVRALVTSAAQTALLVASGRAFFTPLPAGFGEDKNTVRDDYNSLLLSQQFWRAVEGEHVLIFQLDAALCAASPHK